MTMKNNPQYVIKILTGSNAPQQKFTYKLPENGEFGPWMKPKGKGAIQCCEHGLHAILFEGLHSWISDYLTNDSRIFIAQVKGAVCGGNDEDGKIAVGHMRLILEIKVDDILSTYNRFFNKTDTVGKIVERVTEICKYTYPIMTQDDFGSLPDNPSNPDNKIIR